MAAGGFGDRVAIGPASTGMTYDGFAQLAPQP
jgi:hypothetical protein